MTIQLSDDGTLDTVLRCSECGEEFRFSFDGTYDDDGNEIEEPTDEQADAAYGAFVDESIRETSEEHECKSTHQTPVTADNYFDAAQALYWYATAWHGGQDSELYSILSARLGYSPGFEQFAECREATSVKFGSPRPGSPPPCSQVVAAPSTWRAEMSPGQPRR